MRICKGTTRKVFVFSSFVIKIPLLTKWKQFLCGLLANIQEKEFNGKYKRLAKVRYCDKLVLILVMERAEELDSEEFPDLYDYLYKNVYNNLPDDNEEKVFMLSDCKPANWGWINKQLVKIDYGG